MIVEKQMALAILEVKNYFIAERLMLTANSENLRYLAAKMVFRKAIDIFPELNVRPPYKEVQEVIGKPRLVK